MRRKPPGNRIRPNPVLGRGSAGARTACRARRRERPTAIAFASVLTCGGTGCGPVAFSDHCHENSADSWLSFRWYTA